MSERIAIDLVLITVGVVLGAGGVLALLQYNPFSFFKEGNSSAATLREELKEAQWQLHERSREVKTLEAAARTATAPIELSAALSGIVSIVTRHLDVDLVAFLLLDESTQELVTQPGAYGLEKDEQIYRISLAEDSSSSVRVFKSGEPFVAGDAQDDPAVISRYAKLWDIRSLMVVPIKWQGRSWGVMRVGSRRPYAFTQEHVDLISAIAEDAGVVLEMAALNYKLHEDAEQLRALSRMKDEFVSTVSHEFKTPLTTIAGFLGLMLEGDIGPVGEDQKRFIGMAENAVHRLSNMVSDLLDISKLEAGMKIEMKPFSLSSLVSSILETHELEVHASKKTLSFESPELLPDALGDQKWISIVLENLISNAIKFTVSGGQVLVSILNKGDCLQVTVQDDGIGISAEDRTHVFEKFYRASNAREVNASGTGLGLAITKKIIDLHGGRLWFDSTLGKGTQFHFIISSTHRYGREDSQVQSKNSVDSEIGKQLKGA